jgi:hypothetical protein
MARLRLGSSTGVRRHGTCATWARGEVVADTRRSSNRLATFIAVGVGLGVTVGVLVGGGPGIAIGAGIGASLGVAVDAMTKRRT